MWLNKAPSGAGRGLAASKDERSRLQCQRQTDATAEAAAAPAWKRGARASAIGSPPLSALELPLASIGQQPLSPVVASWLTLAMSAPTFPDVRPAGSLAAWPMTVPQAPSPFCRNDWALGYKGVSSRWRSQRQFATSERRNRVGYSGPLRDASQMRAPRHRRSYCLTVS